MTNRALARSVPNQRRAYLSFLVGSRRYAVDIQHVFEVSNLVEIAGVPDMPAAILGVVNIRGSIVPVLDLRIRFNILERDLLLTTPIVFLRHGQGQAGTYAIVVDDVEDVLTLFTDEINTTELNKRAPHIVGMVEYKENLIMLLDPVELLASSLEGKNFEEFVDQLHG
jgi:purine-binding chemotaxis protein CheW